jgi:cytosine/adenosine deaminase-related metal-dependent hydrolase
MSASVRIPSRTTCSRRCRLAGLIARVTAETHKAVTTGQVFRCATLGGAKLLGRSGTIGLQNIAKPDLRMSATSRMAPSTTAESAVHGLLRHDATPDGRMRHQTRLWLQRLNGGDAVPVAENLAQVAPG